MSHIHFVGGEKGGVGKSVVARLLTQRCIDRSLPFAALDGDQSSGVLLRCYSEYTQPVDLTAVESADQIVDRALGAERRVLVDLPAQSARALRAWLYGADVFSFARETGVQLSFWHVSDGGFASVSEIESALEQLSGEVSHVVVKNYGRAKDFSQFDQSGARRKLDELSGKVLELPELESSSMFAIDRSGSSFWAAIHGMDGDTALRPLDRQRVRLWLKRCYAELDKFDGLF